MQITRQKHLENVIKGLEHFISQKQVELAQAKQDLSTARAELGMIQMGFIPEDSNIQDNGP